MIDSLILTHTNDLARLDAAIAAGRYTGVKVVTGWGLTHAWTDAERAQVATMASTLIVRTVAGDPSYNNGQYLYPVVNDVMRELTPWFRAAPSAYYEIGNEPNIARTPPVDPHVYAYYLTETIGRIRAQYPAARIIGTGMIADATLEDWVLVLKNSLALCDAAAIHAYAWRDYLPDDNGGQLQHAIDTYAKHLPGLPLFLTEYGINGSDVPDATKAERDADMLESLPQVVIGASRYHGTTAPLGADQDAYAVNAAYLHAYAAAKEGTMAPPIDSTAHRSPNHDNRPKGATIWAIIVHSCEGSPPGDEQQSSIPWLCNPASEVSCHYYITRAGVIYQLVDDAQRAWHAGTSVLNGVWYCNDYSLGIELEHKENSAPYPMAQIDALSELCRAKIAQYGMARSGIATHRQVAEAAGRDDRHDPSDVSDSQFASWADRLFKTADTGRYVVKAGTIGATVVTSPNAIRQMIAPGAWWDAPTVKGPMMTLQGYGSSDDYVGDNTHGYIWKPLLSNRP